jgi:hypothetical protein
MDEQQKNKPAKNRNSFQMVKLILLLVFIAATFFCSAQVVQPSDSSLLQKDSTIIVLKANDTLQYLAPVAAKVYYGKNNVPFTCKKPKLFDFLTNIPANSSGYIKQSFQKKNLYKIGIVAGSTLLLYLLDRKINNGVQDFARRNNISAEDSYSPIISLRIFGKETPIGKWPHNFNTMIYNWGQGSTFVIAAAGFLIGGKIANDNRALQTASQLIESFLALGASTQIIKYSTGRQTPSVTSSGRGRWRPFTSLSNFQNQKPQYDAFPSGHLATFISGITIISENYPKLKWVKPIGYTVSALLSLVMINNGVHWASDYPLGFAIGYGYGKFIAKKNQRNLKPVWKAD